MATVSKRQRKIGVDDHGDPVYVEEGWQVRYVNPDGQQRKQKFATKREADRFRSEVETDIAKGGYIDAAAGRETFQEYAERWAAVQPWRPGTMATNLTRLRCYVFPVLGDAPIGAIRRTDVQAMVKAAQVTMNGRKVDGEAQPLAISTVHAIAAAAQAVFLAAVEDKVIVKSPADKLALPKLDDDDLDDEGEVVALTYEQFRDFEAGLPKRWRIGAWIGVGSGLRVGEVCGLSEDRVDFLRNRRLRVNRQMLPGQVFGPPKTKASKRWVPVSDTLLSKLAAHLAEFPDPDRQRGLILTGERGGPTRAVFLEAVATAARAAGMRDRQRFHSLRHTYASMLISGGCSIKVVQKRLGHEKIQETLDTYSHMLPDDDDKSLVVVEAGLRAFSVAPTSPQGVVDNSV